MDKETKLKLLYVFRTSGIQSFVNLYLNYINKNLIPRYDKYLQYLDKHLRLVWKFYKILAKYENDNSVKQYDITNHDLSKFSNLLFKSYALYFYNPDGSKALLNLSKQFDKAWNQHQKINKHHWQYWLLYKDDGSIIPLDMDLKYIYEMVADWLSAGYCITGKLLVNLWYNNNKNKIKLSDSTRLKVLKLLNSISKNKSIFLQVVNEFDKENK